MKVRDLIIHLMSNYNLDDEITDHKSLHKESGYPLTKENPYGLEFVHTVQVDIERRDATLQEVEGISENMKRMGIDIEGHIY